MGSGERGKDRARDFDRKLMGQAKETLDLIYDQYTKTSDPFDSFYANEIERMTLEVTDKKRQIQDKFSLQRDNAKKAFDLQRSQGQRTYEEQVAATQQEMKNVQAQARDNAVDVRAQQGEAAYSALTQQGAAGLAGGGGRARKMMAAKAKRGVGKLTLSLTQTRQQMEDKLKAADVQRQMSTQEKALGLASSTQAAELDMNQQRENLDKDLATFTDKQLQEQESTMDRLIREAQGTVSSTIASFTDPYSSWSDDNGVLNSSNIPEGTWNPWKTPFDNWDATQGI